MDDRASGRREDPGEPLLINRFVLRTRTLAALRRAGITTIGQVRSLSDRDLLSVVNVGPKSVADLHRALAGQSLKRQPEDSLSCLALPRPLSDRDEAMVNMHASGAGFPTIARHFGISRSRAEQILERAREGSD